MNTAFELISSDPVEYNSMAMRSKLIVILTKFIRDQGWTQTSAAKKLGVSQPRISNLMNGKIDKFSVDMLLEILFKLGYTLDMRFNPMDHKNPLDIRITRV
ncbi:MAG: XRE family transcriptional regulator [Alteromonadaceae bacterium]|nr:XRE family transcriptional regulator [Alteromonadaceae bacterium]